MLKDRYRLQRELKRLSANADKNSDRLAKVLQQLERSVQLAEQRAARVPTIDYPEQLPVSARRAEIAEALRDNQVIILAGETGSGKTTQLPKICLEIGRGIVGRIGHTQPRRLAARSVAQRIAEELKVEPGNEVGYQVRFTDQVRENTLIKLMTDGILLTEIQRDPFLNQYDTIIIDEAHERSLNIDFLLGYLKNLLPKRPDLKLIVTSATIDLQRFSEHFDNAPVLEVSGRTYPVEIVYQPLAGITDREESEPDGYTLTRGVLDAIEQIRNRSEASMARDILVFLAGERDIREIARAIKDRGFSNLEVLPLYSRLSASEQLRVFKPHTGQRVVLATNVAETSITVPGIRYVIDPGYARISRYSVRSGIQGLPIEPISQASANQRAGRCGRVAEGMCIRLYDEQDFEGRPKYTDAEIQRTNLASVILQMLSLGLGDVAKFPFVEPPETRAIKAGYQVLKELGAVTSSNKLTKLGRQLGKIPLDPRLARMMIEAGRNGSLEEVTIIAAALAIQDPRERPIEKRQAADEKHRVHEDENSDFLAFLNLWRVVEEQRQDLSQNQFRQYCRKHFLSFMRIREWRDVHRQLLLVCRELGLKKNHEAADYGAVHRALLSGLLNHIGTLDTKQEYIGARNRRFYIFPGSALFKTTPKWILAAEIIETSRVYARTVAKIDPQWIEPLAGHLLKRQYAEPQWNAKRGQVIAQESVLLYGLRIASHRVDYSKIDAAVARDIFIRHGLVEQELNSKIRFYVSNMALRAELAQLEEKSRRRDVLVDDEVLVALYDARLPPHICSRNSLERWYKEATREQQRKLEFSREELLRDESDLVSLEQFPDRLQVGKTHCRLEYRFTPGEEGDGVNLHLPLGLLNQVSEPRLHWLVPGMFRDMCIALVKLLPKSIRKQLVPVPQTVDGAIAQISYGEGRLAEALSLAMRRVAGVSIAHDEWQLDRLEPFYRINIRVLDEQGKLVRQGRQLSRLRAELQAQVNETIQQVDNRAFARSDVSDWDFGTLLRGEEVEQGGITLKLYTALAEDEGKVNLIGVDSRAEAEELSRQGLIALIIARTPDQQRYLRKNLPHFKQIQLYYSALGDRASLEHGLIKAAYRFTFLDDQDLPLDAEAFNQRIETQKGNLVANCNTLCNLLLRILELHHQVAHAMEERAPPAWDFVYQDIKLQLNALFPKNFIETSHMVKLNEYPRYLKAILLRLDKIQNQLEREQRWCQEFAEYWDKYQAAKQECERQRKDLSRVIEFRWMIEEYRVSLYAQTLGTPRPISAKRLDKFYKGLENQ